MLVWILPHSSAFKSSLLQSLEHCRIACPFLPDFLCNEQFYLMLHSLFMRWFFTNQDPSHDFIPSTCSSISVSSSRPDKFNFRWPESSLVSCTVSRTLKASMNSFGVRLVIGSGLGKRSPVNKWSRLSSHSWYEFFATQRLLYVLL